MNSLSARQAMLSRRTVLQAAGVAIALPLLDAMRPAVCSSAWGAESSAEPPRRMIAIQTNQGIMPHLFFPEQAGKDYKLSPYLQTLAPLRNDMTVFSGMSHPGVDGGHSNEQSFLTGAPHPAGAAFRNSLSFDQLAAEQIGAQTRFPCLVVSCSNSSSSGMSYTRAGVKIPAETSAAKLYRQLFVQGSEKEIEERVHDLESGRSLLDTVRERARRLEKTTGPADRQRLDQYFTAIRELEQQLLQSESWQHKPKPQVELPEPTDVSEPAQLLTRLRSTLEVLRLAFETDSTRVVSLFVQPLGVLSEIPGVASETHSLTHHGNRPEMISELRIIEEAQLAALKDFLLGLKNAREENGTLLDHTAVLYGTCMGNANGHTNQNWPMLLAGGGFRHGQHLAFDTQQNEPIANLFVSVLQRLGLETDRFSSSTGALRGLEMV
ncbi:DUF1552 domain-containing protein [Lignipirellula cremea]|uniref:DUF1552 domain-containing protein n=1 Tax=Lignipirellula cremea TaxID=2528010 RepID=A0A518DM31_9BACT|nr:DUF1552 domain-containing protein [Lignipirellula cremea]QDU92894.1 hypothetical protein Pla8534_06670 [Lignipirellula cremea]